MILRILILLTVVFPFPLAVAEAPPKVAIVPGGDPKPEALLALSEAKLFELKGIELLERTEIDKVLAEQKLSGLFDAVSVIELGRILRADLFAVLETTSIVIFDAQTGLRFVDETLPESIEEAAQIVAEAVTTAIDKRQKLDQGNLVTFGVLEVRNADFPVDRDAWCRAVAGMLERSLLHRDAAVLERSRFQHVNRERQLTGDTTNDLLTSMKLIDLEFTRGEIAQSFKLTARIGDETFRVDSFFDEPLVAVCELVELLKGDVTIKKENEARRYQREADFLYNQGRFEDALDRAETALALDPDNAEIKQSLYFILLAVAAQMVDSEGRLNPKAEQILEKLQFASRALDLFETGFSETVKRDFNPTGGGLGFFIDRLIGLSAKYPECQPSVKAFHRRVVEQSMKAPAPHYISNDKSRNRNDPTTKFEVAIHNAHAIFLSPYMSSSTSAINIGGYEIVLPHLVQLFHDIPEEALVELSAKNVWNSRFYLMSSVTELHFHNIMESFINDATSIRNAKPEDRDEDDLRRYDHLISMMENDPSPMIQNYGWMARNNPIKQVIRSKYYTPEQATEYYEKLKQRIEEQPPVRRTFEVAMLYDTMSEMASYRVRNQANLQHLPGFVRVLPYEAEILETAIQRKENIKDVQFFDQFCRSPSSLVSRADQERYEKLADDYLAMIETVAPQAHEYLKQNIRRDVIRITPQPTARSSQFPKPWKEEIPLVSLPNEVDSPLIFQPFVRNNTLYYFFVSADRTKTSLNSIDLETHQIKQGATFPSCPASSPDVYPFPGHVDNQNAYITLRSASNWKDTEICVFPLNGGEAPWSFGPEMDFPSRQIRHVCSFNGKLYVVMAESTTFFIAIDLKTKVTEILSSSSAREGKAPFFNLSPAPSFCGFFADKPRNRLVFFLGSSLPEWGGIWSMDGETGRFTHHLSQTHAYPHQMQIFDNPDRLLISESARQYTILFDLNDLTEWRDPILHRDSLGTVTNVQWFLQNKGVTSFYAFTYQNALWGYFGNSLSHENYYWNRLSMTDQSRQQHLEPLKNIKRPIYFVPLPSDNGLVVGDWFSLVLLRFE